MQGVVPLCHLERANKMIKINIMKNLIVQKYGGSSVADPDRIKNVAKRVIRYKQEGHSLVIVVSALGDTTDELLDLVGQITENPQDRELDMLLATGEQISVALLAMAIHSLGHEAISFTGAQVGIVTDASHTKARILDINSKRIEKELAKNKIVIVAGFQGVNLNQDITTLGRGGSDLTAVALAKALRAPICEIYTDVDGVYTADPRIVPNARKLERISYEEMLEMASLGSQVMQARSIEVAKKFNVTIHVRSSFHNQEGTLISEEVSSMEEVLVSGVSLNKKEAKVTVCDVPDKPGVAAKIFGDIANADVNVDMIVQNVSRTGQTDISFTVDSTELKKAIKAVEKVARGVKAGQVVSDEDIAKVSIVGVGMRSHTGVAAKMFEVLASKKINIEMISTSEIKISILIRKAHAEEAVRALHDAFELGKNKK